jgi:cytochrome bd-type quinol oxidase subunit 2
MEAKMGEGQPKKDRSTSKFSRRQKLYWSSFIAAAIFGIAMAWFLETTGGYITHTELFDFSKITIPKNYAIIGSVMHLLAMTIISFLYHKGMDEQEERSYLIANNFSWYFLLAAVPIWGLLSQADIASPTDGITIAITSLFINIAVWA